MSASGFARAEPASTLREAFFMGPCLNGISSWIRLAGRKGPRKKTLNLKP